MREKKGNNREEVKRRLTGIERKKQFASRASARGFLVLHFIRFVQ